MSTLPLSPPLPLVTEAPSELASYAYSYPHKSSYDSLDPPVPIAAAWQGEDVRRLALYVHVPFCEMRCGFCNLFTQSLPAADIVTAYLVTLRRQMRVVREAIPQAEFNQLAIGGGTPTFLAADQLRHLFDGIEANFAHAVHLLAASVEVSPATATRDRLQVLADFGVERVSIGVQSFLTDEVRHIGRPQLAAEVSQALAAIRDGGFPVLNIDLIYGSEQQTLATWLASLHEALQFRPEELYLYPLYIRPATGLAFIGRSSALHRQDLYSAARDLLFERGYEQASLRCFRLPRAGLAASYGCQRDGMIGLGCGARSYTRRLHYASKFAVTQAGVRAILGQWIEQSDEELALATHGIWLSASEQRRRFLVLSLLQAEGLSLAEFHAQFPGASLDEFPILTKLGNLGWLERTIDRYTLTPAGMMNSDTIGPLLYSPSVRERLRMFTRLSELRTEAVR
jgi:oxygen-independent coproporphyrinogen-3 oxidase